MGTGRRAKDEQKPTTSRNAPEEGAKGMGAMIRKMRGGLKVLVCGVVMGGACAPVAHAQDDATRAAAAAAVGTSEPWRDRSTWPPRLGRGSTDATQGVVIELPTGRDTHVWRSIPSRSAAALGLWDTTGDAARLLEAVPEADRPRVLTEVGQGGFGFVRQEKGPEERAEDPACVGAMMFVTGREEIRAGLDLDPGGVTNVTVLERTWFALYDPKKGPARGIAVLMPGLFGTPEAVFDQVVRHLQSRRWVVVRMMAQPSGYTGRLDVDINPDDPTPVARQIAATFDERAAECAYAVEAALAWAAEKRPEVQGLQRVILGGSGGAMSLPPVVARLPDTFDAAVLIAGGADYATIAATSNYEEWVDSVHLRWQGQRGTEEQIRAFGGAYLNESRLDAYHTAVALGAMPVLVYQASRDKAVPALQQELLWERLGRPERRVFTMGHETLFVSLPLRMGGIMDWIDQKLSPAETAQDTGAAESVPQQGP